LEEKRSIQIFNLKDLRVGTLLGMGSFAAVHTVSRDDDAPLEMDGSFHSKPDGKNDPAEPSESNYSFYGSAANQFALKRLRQESVETEEKRREAVIDFLFEFEVLSRLPVHNNIVNLMGRSTNFLEDPEKGFLVLEQVPETLKKRLRSWKRISKMKSQNHEQRPLVPNPFANRAKRHLELRQSQYRRIKGIGTDLAEALKFLHKNRILYRDLKPDNVGIAVDGSVKLLDFGLARPFDQDEAERKLTGQTGTPRYMAPEVAQTIDYGAPADVYSFSMVLWEICTLEQPFQQFNEGVDVWYKQAVVLARRPSLKNSKIASPLIRELLKTCWDHDPELRPSFALICQQLSLEIGHHKDQESTTTSDF